MALLPPSCKLKLIFPCFDKGKITYTKLCMNQKQNQSKVKLFRQKEMYKVWCGLYCPHCRGSKLPNLRSHRYWCSSQGAVGLNHVEVNNTCIIVSYYFRVWIYLKSWEWYGKILAIPCAINEKIREINLQGIPEILEAENPRVLFGYTSLSSQPLSSVTLCTKNNPPISLILTVLCNCLRFFRQWASLLPKPSLSWTPLWTESLWKSS